MHWFYDPAIALDSSSISAAELVHFKSLRISHGDQITVSSGKGYGFTAKVIDPVTGAIEIEQRIAVSDDVKIHLVQAIAKGGRDESALQACTELGISSATALQAERSISLWGSKVTKNLERWTQIVISSIKQSQQLTLPEVSFSDSVKSVAAKGTCIVLDPRGDIQIAEVPESREYTVAVGPEGGFSDSEIQALKGKGFIAARLGDSVLRTSTAGVVAISCLKLSSGQFGKRLV